MKLKYLYIFLLPVITTLLLLAAFSTGNNPEEKSGNEKIIKFSHSLHAELADCSDLPFKGTGKYFRKGQADA